MPAFFQTKKKQHFFFNQWLKQLLAGRAPNFEPRADHTPLPCWLHPKGRNSKGSRCTWAGFLIENAGNSVFWCFSNGLFDGVLTIFWRVWCFCGFLWWFCSWLMVFGCLFEGFLDCLLWWFFDGFWWFLPFQYGGYFAPTGPFIWVWSIETICRASASIQAARQQIGVHFKKNGSWTTLTLHLATILAYWLYHGYIMAILYVHMVATKYHTAGLGPLQGGKHQYNQCSRDNSNRW